MGAYFRARTKVQDVCLENGLRKKVAFTVKFIIAPALLVVVLMAVRIYTYGNKSVDVKADAAIVL